MFSGYLVKIGTWAVPLKYIKPADYKTSDTPEKLADWYDCENTRHVVYATRSVPAVTFSTSDNFKLHEADVDLFREALEAAKNTDGTYAVTYYSMEDGTYKTANMTLEGLQYPIWGVSDDDVFYDPITFTFKGV